MNLITAGDRPASVFYRGGEVRIDVHDAWYSRLRNRMLADLRALHPDTAGFHDDRRTYRGYGFTNGAAFRYASRLFKSWQAEQREWYAEFGMTPPRHGATRREKTPMAKLWDHNSNYKPPIRTRHMVALERAKFEERGIL